MISYYFSPHRGVTKWRRDDFIKLVTSVKPLRHYVSENSFLRQTLSAFTPRAIMYTKKIDSDIDFFVRFEQLDDDFKKVCKFLDIPNTPLPRRNVSDRAHYSKYYDDELKDFVGERFLEEIIFGHYSFDYI